MMMFGRKEEDDFEEGVEEKKLPPKRKFRDLRPEGKKKRGEPIKPWGKKERSLVLAVLIVTALTPAILAMSAREWKLPGMPRLAFSLPKISFEKTIVFEEEKRTPDFSSVKENFLAAINNLSGVYGLFVYRLGSGYSYGISQGEQFQAASLIKLPVFIALYQMGEEGVLDLDAKYVLRSEDRVGGSGSLQTKIGNSYTYRELAMYMGQQSDNTAFAALRKIIGDEKIKNVIADIGMRRTSLEENLTTPEDIGLLLRKLYDGELLDSQSRDEVFDFLTNTIYEDHLPKGLPDDIRVVHKYGREVHVVNDAGIVFAAKPYVLVIMSKGVVESEADEIFPVLSKIVYDFENAN